MRRGLTAKLSAFDRPAARPSSRFSTRRVSSTWPRSSSQVRAYPDIEIGDAVRIDGEVESGGAATCRSSPRRSSSWRARRAETVRRRLAEALTAEARPGAPAARGRRDGRRARRRAARRRGGDPPRGSRIAADRRAPPGHRRRLRRRCRGRARRSSADPRGTREKRRGVPLHPPAARRPGVRDGRGDERRDPHADRTATVTTSSSLLFLLVGTGSTTESADGIDLLSVYGVNAVVVDAEVADPERRARPSTRSSRPRSTGSTPTSRRARSSPRWPPRSTTKFERTSTTRPR